MSGRAFVYVQSLRSVGPLLRTAAITRAMVDLGLDVTVAPGGPPVPGVVFEHCARVSLPPFQAADSSFELLLDVEGRPIDDAWRDRRMARLIFEFETIRPSVLLVVLFPFDARPFRFELLPLLDAARAMRRRPAILCSVRDVVAAPADAGTMREMVALATTYFDQILVHGDPAVLRFESSFPEAAQLTAKITYTGYVATATTGVTSGRGREEGRGEVIVSAGGGAEGESLLTTALAARPLSRLRQVPWRLITGPYIPDQAFEALQWNKPEGVIVERWRTDLPLLLRHAIVSLSHAGYQTVSDLLGAAGPAVVAPAAGAREIEHTLRGRAWAARGAFTFLEPSEMAPETVARALEMAVAAPRPLLSPPLEGARFTAEVISSWCAHAGDVGKTWPHG